MTLKRGLLACCGLYLGVSLAQGAHAQASSSSPGEPDNTGARLSEIVVTAQKRAENVQNTPIAITAVSGNTLIKEGVDDFTQLNKVAPNVQVFSNTGATVISIRGIQPSDYGPTAESTAAVHIDGVYLSREEGLTGLFYDLQRVEVLAGPQGTLFGRNAVAGVINILTNRPTQTFGGNLDLELGSHSLVRGEGALNVPLTDTLAVRVAAQNYTHAGYYKNGLDDQDQKSVRVEALWKPTTKDQLLLTADYSHVEGKGPSDTPYSPKDIQPNVQALDSLVPVTKTLRDNTLFYGTAPSAEINEDIWGASVQYDHTFQAGDAILEFGHRDVRANNFFYQGGGYGHIPQVDHTNSLEARFVSPSHQLLEYVAGFYYFQEHVSGDNQGYSCLPGSGGDPANNPKTCDNTGGAPQPTVDIANPLQTTNAYAGFGQATLNLFDSLHVTLGARYSEDEKQATTFTHLFGPVPPEFHGKGSWSRLTYRANLSYDLTPTSLVYGTVSTGFKAGGFAYGNTPRYNPETLTAYEVGSKNRFFGNRLQVNLEGFDYQYKNFEVLYAQPVTIGGVPYFSLLATNAGNAQVYGAGISADLALTADDRFSANVQYLHAQYGRYDLSYLLQPDYSGGTFPNTPKWQGQGSYNHTFHVGESQIVAEADVQYGGRRNMLRTPKVASDQFPAIYQDAYAVVDLSVRYTPPGGRWDLTAYVRNVGDTVYTNQVTYVPPQPVATVFESLNDPRMIGVIGTVRF